MKPVKSHKNIAQLARIAEVMTLGGLAILAAVTAFLFVPMLFGGAGTLAHLQDQLDMAPSPIVISVWQRIFVVVLLLIPLGLGAAMLLVLRSLFSGIRKHGFFTTAAAVHLKRVGWILIAMVPVGFLVEGLGTMAMTMNQPDGKRSISLSLNDTDVYALVIGLTIVILSKILLEGVQLLEENKAFV